VRDGITARGRFHAKTRCGIYLKMLGSLRKSERDLDNRAQSRYQEYFFLNSIRGTLIYMYAFGYFTSVFYTPVSFQLPRMIAMYDALISHRKRASTFAAHSPARGNVQRSPQLTIISNTRDGFVERREDRSVSRSRVLPPRPRSSL